MSSLLILAPVLLLAAESEQCESLSECKPSRHGGLSGRSS